MKHIRSKSLKFLAVFVAFNIFVDAISPLRLFALTGGPKSPEFMSFTPVATTNMVDLLSGDFNYNLPVIEIPGAEGGGYALSLAYNSGVNCEQEASWVGFGWNLSPGAIDRNMRGFPDDVDGDIVKYYKRSAPNWSITKNSRMGLEIKSWDVGASLTQSTRFNNHQGFYNSIGLGISAVGLGMNINYDREGVSGITFSASINPSRIISKAYQKASDNMCKKVKDMVEKNGYNDESSTKIELMNLLQAKANNPRLPGISTSFGLYSFSETNRSTSFENFHGFSLNLRLTEQVNLTPLPIGYDVGLYGNFNVQYNQDILESLSYGFLHQPPPSSEENTTGAVMDYYTEKGSDYNNRDLFIGMPFSNADIFSVCGDGLTGGFRAYGDKINFFKPSSYGDNTSKLDNYNIGLEVMVGANFGMGLNIGYGYNKTKLLPFSSYNNTSSNSNYHFRFNNDLGGTIEYGNTNTDIITAELTSLSNIPGFKDTQLNESLIIEESNILESKEGASSYISSHTFSDVKNNPNISFTKLPNQTHQIFEQLKVNSSNIAEFSIFSKNGDNYVYSIPVLTRNETSLSFDIQDQHTTINNYLAFRETPIKKSEEAGYENDYTLELSDQLNTAIGEIRNKPYSTSFLLTQITNSNYVDIKDDGITEDDFGGWTKFNYRQIYGGLQNWYRYRTPYNGLMYDRGSISDKRDDIGSVSTGEKEIYYLETIETKTHIAFFVTNKYVHNSEKYPEYNVQNGTGTIRLDGYDASALSSNSDPASFHQKDNGENDLQYLEKIILFAKNRPGKPIKTVCFDYDWSLVPGLPNNISKNLESSGKLTLKKVWFEYEGLKQAKISPYVFEYKYTKSANVQSGSDFFEEYDDLPQGQGSPQNPFYSPWLLDTWGNVMEYGEERKGDENRWVYQGFSPNFNPSGEQNWRSRISNEVPFDPSAWHLKKIKLPSGGEIHIQYEQKDYKYVQDRPSMAMASIIGVTNTAQGQYVEINVDDLGCDPYDYDEVTELKQSIENYLYSAESFDQDRSSPNRKVYFKFLFDLVSNSPRLNNSKSEYISGYSHVQSIDITTKDSGSDPFYSIRLFLGSTNSEQGDKSVTPNKGALDFLYNQRNGIVNNIFGDIDLIGLDRTVMSFKDKEFDRNLGNFIIDVSKLFKNNTINKPYDKFLTFSKSLSYLKLPVYKNKKGGGVRVKRLLMYDSGIENGDSQVLGQQFHYVLDDGVSSSGVATNEPSSAREENPLIEYMVRKGQSKWSRLSVGEDKEQTEGPLGESILPGPSIVHSRVVVENIHSQKLSTGFTVHEFYTTKDYPFDYFYGSNKFKNYNGETENYDFEGKGVEMTNLNDNKVEDFIPDINLFIFSYKMGRVDLAQGFRFIQNSFNGLQKQVTSYGGKYLVPEDTSQKDTDNGYIVSLNKYEYFEPGEKVSVLKKTQSGYDIVSDTPGKEIEVSTENKKIKNTYLDISVEFDLSIGFAGLPIPFVGFVPNFSYSNESVATYATTKIVKYPAILKSQTSLMDGLYSKTENLVFNPSTGDPIITKTYDGYYNKDQVSSTGKIGEVYTFAVPADLIYPKMGQKAKNIDNTNQLTATAMSLTTYGSKPSPNWLTEGPIPKVLSASATTYSNDWSTSWEDIGIKTNYPSLENENAAEKLNKLWRPVASYVYKNVGETSSPELNLYKSGYFDINSTFNFEEQPANSWLKVSEITKYSPNGNPIEEVDIMNIPSAVLYGSQYGNNVPVMISYNANYGDFYFDDFERDNSEISTYRAHSGLKSMQFFSGSNIINGNVTVSENLAQKGGELKVWIYTDPIPEKPPVAILSNQISKLRKVASSGAWTLYDCYFTPQQIGPVGSKVYVSLDEIPNGTMVFVDDVRFQPNDAMSTCYVYDHQTLKLLTQFDDQHFGMYYKYNEEGVLTHKQVETERGIKTIQETQYNIPKVIRDNEKK